MHHTPHQVVRYRIRFACYAVGRRSLVTLCLPTFNDNVTIALDREKHVCYTKSRDKS